VVDLIILSSHLRHQWWPYYFKSCIYWPWIFASLWHDRIFTFPQHTDA